MTPTTLLLVVINFLFLSSIKGDDSSGCPSGWVRNSGQCYMFSTEEKSWNEADAFCRNINSGAHLVSIDSPAEHDFVFSNIEEWFWTGGLFSNGEWTWRDGTLVESENWFYGQPSNKGGANMCRAVQIFSTLAVAPCGKQKKFICEREDSNASSGNSNTGCPPGWKSKFGNCYKWFFTAPKTWHDAFIDCLNQGGNLISIHDDAVNEFISKTVRGTVWTGGRRTGDGWTWSDGTPWNFGTVQDIGSSLGGGCATTFNKSASGFDCNGRRLYICKNNMHEVGRRRGVGSSSG